LSDIMNNPQGQPEEYVNVANWLFTRSANLVAASLAGLIQVLIAQNEAIKNVCLAADGSVFWKSSALYPQQVANQLKTLLPEDVVVTMADQNKMVEPNLIGSAIAALS